MEAITATLLHFNFSDQLTGFWGSSLPSQSTMLGSSSVCVVCSLSSSGVDSRLPCSRSISSSVSELAGDFSSRWPLVELIVLVAKAVVFDSLACTSLGLAVDASERGEVGIHCDMVEGESSCSKGCLSILDVTAGDACDGSFDSA